MKEVTTSNVKTIRSLFPNAEELLICLFPFQKQVFADHFNLEANLKLAYPLLWPISWKEISEEIGFNSLNRLAKGILELQEPFKTELNEYCEWKKVEFPEYAADRIPALILIPLIQYFRQLGIEKFETKCLDRFPDSEARLVSFENKDEFEIYQEIKDEKALTTQNGFEIMLPDYDCPYAIMSGSKEICVDIVKTCSFEYLNTKKNISIDWWNQE